LKSKILQRYTNKAQRDKALFESGQEPESRFKNPLQRSAAKMIAGFFALMLLLTIVSSAADGLTVAVAQTDVPRTGTITERVELSGFIQPLDSLDILLPSNIYITAARVEEGQKVSAGDVLLEFDLDDVSAQLEEQKNNLAVAEAKLKITENGASASDNTALANAELNLKQAQDDYDRQKEKLSRSAARAAEDYANAENDLAEAKASYNEALEKAKSDMIESAKTKRDAAQKALDEAKSAANEAIENARYSYEQARSNAQKSIDNAVKNAEAALASAKTALEETKATQDRNVQSAESKPDATDEDVEWAKYQRDTAVAKAEKQVSDAQANLDEAKSAGLPDDVARAYDSWQSTVTKQNAKIADAQTAYNDAVSDYNDALAGRKLLEQQAVVSAQNSVNSAQKSLNNAKRSLEDSGQNIDDQLLSAARSVSSAQRSLEQAQRDAADKERTAENSKTQTSIDIITQRSNVASLKKTVASLEEIIAMDGKVLAPIDAVVQTVSKTGKTQDKVAAATLSRNDTGFRFEAKTDANTAEGLALGDWGQLSYKSDGASQRVRGTVTDIGAADGDGNSLILVSVPAGTYPAGASGTLTITRSSERQNTCLPVSALRSDSDGDYVFVAKEKKTVTGVEYTASRVDVTILARDSSLVSVQSGLARDDMVITSVNKPIEEGDRVRLEQE